MTARPPVSVLVVDDEEKIRQLVATYLRHEGFDVLTAGGGEEAVELTRTHQPALIVLDVMMPGVDGIEALRRIRTFSDAYVLVLSARAEETDKVIGLSVGADDYLTKPFSPRELVARVKAILRRARPADDGGGATRPTSGADRPEELVVRGALRIDRDRHEVHVDDRPVTLTALEFQLLDALAAQPGRVFSRRQLLERVWGWDFVGDDRVVDVHIRNLRKALGDDATDPHFIGTVRSVGYRFVAGDR